MFRHFDFSMPLTVERLRLLTYCIDRYKQHLYARSAELELHKYMTRILATQVYTEPAAVCNGIYKHIDYLCSFMSDTVFPFDPKNYEEAAQNYSAIKEQYKRYLETLEKAEKAKKEKDAIGN